MSFKKKGKGAIDLTIGLFKKKYTVRQHTEQTIDGRGYASAPYTDTVMRLNVQPLTPNELMALPEGDRTVKRVKSFGPDRLTAADDLAKIPGDRLYYNGAWFECTSSVMWDHTILSHYRSDFTMLPPDKQMPAPEPPAPPVDPDPTPPEGGATP